MKKFALLGLLACSSVAFASSNASATKNSKVIDMSDLKCGSYQIYATSTVQDIRDNCKIIKEGTMSHTNELNLPKKYWHGQKTLFELHFTGSNQKEKVVRCDFLNSDPKSVVIGCR